MTIREWMEEEYAIEKRNIEGNAKREHIQASTRRISSKTSYSNKLFTEAKIEEEEGEVI